MAVARDVSRRRGCVFGRCDSVRWVVSVAYLLGGWLSLGYCDATAQGLTIDDVIRIAEASRSDIRGMEVGFVIRQEVVEDPGKSAQLPRPAVEQLYSHLRMEYQSDRYFYTYKAGEDAPQLASAFDGVVETLYNDQSGQGAVTAKNKPGINPQDKNPFLAAAMMFPPRPGGFGMDDSSIVSFLRNGTLREQTEIIDGHTCYVVDASAKHIDGHAVKYATMWVDVERGVLPIQIEIFGDQEEVVTRQRISNVTEFRDMVAMPVWLPARIEKEMRFPGTNATIRQVIEAQTDLFQLNPEFTAESFRVEFAPGTVVIDTASDTSFTVPLTTPVTVPRSSNSLGWLLGFSAILIFLVIYISVPNRKT